MASDSLFQALSGELNQLLWSNRGLRETVDNNAEDNPDANADSVRDVTHCDGEGGRSGVRHGRRSCLL